MGALFLVTENFEEKKIELPATWITQTQANTLLS